MSPASSGEPRSAAACKVDHIGVAPLLGNPLDSWGRGSVGPVRTQTDPCQQGSKVGWNGSSSLSLNHLVNLFRTSGLTLESASKTFSIICSRALLGHHGSTALLMGALPFFDAGEVLVSWAEFILLTCPTIRRATRRARTPMVPNFERAESLSSGGVTLLQGSVSDSHSHRRRCL